MRRQRGTSLAEVVLAAAIVAMLAAAALDFTLGRRPFALRSALTHYDAALAYAQALALSANGATLRFDPASAEPGFVLTVLAGRIDMGTASPSSLPPIAIAADVAEDTLGVPPFALVVDPAGHAQGYAVPAQSTVPCAGGWTLRFHAGTASDRRSLPCPLAVAGSPAPPLPMAVLSP